MKKNEQIVRLTSWGCVGCLDKCLIITESEDPPLLCPYGKTPNFIKQKRRK